jgi:pyrroloquinoline quinone biosynthesis protein D
MFFGPCSMQFIMPTEPQITDKLHPRLAPRVRLQIDCTTGKGVLLFPEGILELNETAYEILTRCDGRTLSALVRALAEEYDVDLPALAADVHETLADLQRRKLVELG